MANVSFILILVFMSLGTVKNEVFTAVTDLEDLVQTESHLVRILENYIKAEEDKLIRLKSNIYKTLYDQASKDIHLYVTNPINAYILIKRLTIDWREVENLISTNLSLDYMGEITQIKETMKFPTDEDLTGAAVALTRLQDTYALDTSSLAKGELNGVKYSSELSAGDCFELGRQSYKAGNYRHSQLWIREAESRLQKEMNESVDRSDILEYSACSSYKQGNVSLALDFTFKLLEVLPTHSCALDKVCCEEKLENLVTEKKGDEGFEGSEIDPDMLKWYRLCRGETLLTVEESSKLKCRYWNRNHPFLLLAPFKVEEAHHKPDVFIFYDVLGDTEIATIKEMATPKLMRSGVVIEDAVKFWEFRVSKTAWLSNDVHKHLSDINQRVSDMTGLNMETSEPFQCLNYGIGGLYLPHHDFFAKNQTNTWGFGNRIATVLFYVSDVEQGGATVFPYIDVALWPKKGSAAFWYNLHPSGDGDVKTMHGACPILMGSKWALNKWIHERGQEFLRPCTLERPSEDSVI